MRPYVEDDLAKGRLVAPFSVSVPKKRAWYLLYRAFRKDDPGLAVLRNWLRESLTGAQLAAPNRVGKRAGKGAGKGAASRSA